MEKMDIKIQTMKLTFLEMNPPINELTKNKEEINIIFQGHDNFYDFKKYLSSKAPIQLNRYKKSLMMTLLKSNNIMATGLLNVRPGEQNVIFNYEDKKNNAQKKTVNINNLLDSIKIKIFCEFDINTNSNYKDKIINRINNNKQLNIKDNRINDSLNNKYIPKVNSMKQSHHKYKNNNANKNNIEKKKKFLGNFYSNNSMKKNYNFINSSQDFCLGSDYSTFLTEEQNIINKLNNNKNNNNNLNTSEIKKLNPYYSSKVNINIPSRKTDFDTSSKSKNKSLINKAKSKNNFSTIKKYNKQNNAYQMKLNNSSLNLINLNYKYTSIDTNYDSNTNNITSYNKNIIKPTISFNKNNKRNINANNKINNYNCNYNHKNLITSLDHFISGQIIEHVDKSKKDLTCNTNNINFNNSEKKTTENIYKSKNNLRNMGYMGLNTIANNNINNINNMYEKKKRKFNNNNITMNSVSTAGTKKNDLEFSMNSLQDYEDKLNMNKNNFFPFTNRITNERLQQKITEVHTLKRDYTKHNFNKSLCQQSSFADKIFNENDLSNLNDNNNDNNTKNNNSICKSYDKFQNMNNTNNDTNNNDLNDLNNNDNIVDQKTFGNEEKNINNTIGDDIEKDVNEFNNVEEEVDLEMDNFTKLKEDFNLLYNEEYIKQINEDLLKLEIELFIEKMSELFSAYHIQMDEKILENRIINGDYKKNVKNYLLYMKLNNKFQFIKAQKQAKKFNLKEKNVNIDQQNFSNVNINMKELNVFKFIFPDKNKSKELKKIISNILKKKENKELLGEKIAMLLK